MARTPEERDARLREIVTEVHGDGIVLNALQTSDAPRVYEACTGEEMRRFMTFPWPYKRSHADFFVGHYAIRGWESGEFELWAIRERPGGEILGAFELRAQDPPDVGYWLHPDARGRGIMGRALERVCQLVFERGHDAIHWECVEGNLASAAVAIRAGFRFDGTRPVRELRYNEERPMAWNGIRRASDGPLTDADLNAWPAAARELGR